MSGQPYRYATDPIKYRQEYMNVLGIQADIDDMNLQANKVYKQTGQLPPMSQMADTRTTAEIYADVQKLKLGIIRDLAPIADAQFASQIVETMYASPLNSNNKLIIFLAQRAPEIANNLKKIYSFKIKGDINDANVFVNFIEDMYNKSKASFASVESYFNKTGSEVERGINPDDINKTKEIILKIRTRINSIPVNRLSARTRTLYTDAIENILLRIGQLGAVFPTSEQLKKYDLYGLEISQSMSGDDTFVNHLRELHAIIKEELPRPDTIQTAVLHLEKFVSNDDPSEFKDAYTRLMSYLPSQQTFELVERLKRYLDTDLNRLVRRGDIGQIRGEEVRVSANESASDMLNRLGGFDPVERADAIAGVEGNGIRKRGRPKGSGIYRPFEDKIDKSKGIQPDKRYIPLGKFLINNKKLNNNVLAIKRPSGANIIDLPSVSVSSNLSNVFKKIIGGQIPSFNELNELSDEEKLYLHKVAKKADIEDKFSIPTPSKDKMEKDIHSFEVMKGEIMAGNDNKDMVKKFKVLLMKLSRNGTIPKREAQEIMEDLIELGF